MKKTIFFLILILSAVFAGFAQNIIGSITWIDGTVDVYRDGEPLDWWDVDIGLEIEDYDLVETGPDSYVEVEVETPGNSGTVVKMSGNSAFYFEKSAVSGGSRTTFQLLAGSLSLKVAKLTGSNSIDVKTESAIMGVRGTEFEISIAPESSVLVICVEGKVEVGQDEGEYKANAEPGTVVRKDYDANVRGYQVGVEDAGLYKTFWVSAREQVFKSGAKSFIRHYAGLYNTMLPKFLLAFEKLKTVRAALEKYGTMEDGSLGIMIKAKKEVSGPIFEIRSIFPMFEHIFYSIQTLERYHDMGVGLGMIDDTLTSTAFFSGFASKKNSLKRQLAETRKMFKLFLNIDQVTSGGGIGSDIMNDLFDGGNPFNEGGGVPQGDIPKSDFNF